MERPIRVAEHLSGEQNQVGLPVTDDLVRLGGRGDLADCRCGDVHFTADSFSERNLVSGAGGNGSSGDIAP